MKPQNIYNTYAATDALQGYDVNDNLSPDRGRHTSGIERLVRNNSLSRITSRRKQPKVAEDGSHGTKHATDLASGEENSTIVDFRYRKAINALMADNSVQSYKEDQASLIREWNWIGEDYQENSR